MYFRGSIHCGFALRRIMALPYEDNLSHLREWKDSPSERRSVPRRAQISAVLGLPHDEGCYLWHQCLVLSRTFH